MASRFLKLFQYPVKLTFEVDKPEKKPSFNQKLGWTFIALVLYLIMLKVPVYGYVQEGEDPFAALRIILASQRGTLAELGIGPIVTSGMILQLLVGSRIISVNFQDSEERALYTGTQKVLAVLMTLFEAIAYISGGAYGDAVKDDPLAKTLIIVQLVVAGLMIMMLDEIVQKGWGLGSGISLFIATAVSFTIFNGAFSIQDAAYGDDFDPETGRIYEWKQGALIFFFQSIGRGTIMKYGIYNPDFQGNDMFNLFATIVIFAIVIYVESMRIEIPVQHSEHRIPARYPIKFLYVSNIPVILVSALFANIFLIGNLMNGRYADDPGFMGSLTKLIGVWDQETNQPISGLAFYTTAPRGLEAVAESPFRAVMYFLIMTIASTGFAMVWVETAGMSARDVAKQLIGAGMQIPGFRRHPKIIERYLNNYIPYAAFLGGAFIGVLASFADFLGAIGSGVGILLTTGIIKQYFEILTKERLGDINPALAGILGIS
ncbi:MAG: preprotein translocase subunit SecY [Candidatus Heimdallarchaeota archaeon]|nr:preprotein translocase subunit SecY [Candidatus Heimdallarchaeota archaeon]